MQQPLISSRQKDDLSDFVLYGRQCLPETRKDFTNVPTKLFGKNQYTERIVETLS